MIKFPKSCIRDKKSDSKKKTRNVNPTFCFPIPWTCAGLSLPPLTCSAPRPIFCWSVASAAIFSRWRGTAPTWTTTVSSVLKKLKCHTSILHKKTNFITPLKSHWLGRPRQKPLRQSSLAAEGEWEQVHSCRQTLGARCQNHSELHADLCKLVVARYKYMSTTWICTYHCWRRWFEKNHWYSYGTILMHKAWQWSKGSLQQAIQEVGSVPSSRFIHCQWLFFSTCMEMSIVVKEEVSRSEID